MKYIKPEIIEPPKPWTLIVCCDSCETKQQVNKDCIYYDDFGVGMYNNHEWHYFWVCAVDECDTKNIITAEDLPQHVKNAAMNR